MGYRWAIAINPKHLVRYKDLGLLLVKHARAGLRSDVEGELAVDPAVAEDADKLARDLEEMGPTFVKLGQLLSTRADLLPPAVPERAGAGSRTT